MKSKWRKAYEDLFGDLGREAPGNEDNHYHGTIQPTEFMEAQGFTGFHEGQVIKYVCRHKKKGGILDLQKALWYLLRLIVLEEEKPQQQESARGASGTGDLTEGQTSSS